MTPELYSFLNLPQSIVVFYNEYETRDFISKPHLLHDFVIQMFNLPSEFFLFSTPDYWNHCKLFDNNVLAYDWVFLREKRNFDKRNFVDFHGKKKYRILSLNRRPNWERYRYCAYLHEHLPESTQFTYLEYGVQPYLNKDLSISQMEAFNKVIPRQIDGYIPNWESLEGLIKTIEPSYFLTIFETNAQAPESTVQQVSEKS